MEYYSAAIKKESLTQIANMNEDIILSEMSLSPKMIPLT
jgi:hypothetical protein